MTEQLTLKRATTSDIEQIARLLVAYRAFYEKEYVSIEVVSAFVQERLNKNEVVIFLASLDDTARGFAQLYSAYSTLNLGKVWMLYDLYIEESYRGKGIGKALLEQCKNFAVQDNAFRLELKTEPDNLPAVSLYEQFGFLKENVHIHYQMVLK